MTVTVVAVTLFLSNLQLLSQYRLDFYKTENTLSPGVPTMLLMLKHKMALTLVPPNNLRSDI